MGYFNYHAKIKNLILSGHLTEIQFFSKWNKIENCYVLFFDNSKPMPIRNYRWDSYLKFFEENNIEVVKNIDK